MLVLQLFINSREAPTTLFPHYFSQSNVTTCHLTPHLFPAAEVKFNACANYTLLLSGDRQVLANEKARKHLLCDGDLPHAWYRFSSAAGEKMQDSCPVNADCDTGASGWLRYGHPSVEDEALHRHVCFARSDQCCNESQAIVVKNCGDFFVYKLNATSFCPSRFCGGNLTSEGVSGEVSGEVSRGDN